MIMFRRFLALHVGPGRLEHHVEVARDAELCAQRGDVKIPGTQVMEDCGAAVEQRLDVDELPRPVPLLEQTLAECEATRACLLRALRAGQVLRAGQAKYVRPVNPRCPAGILAHQSIRLVIPVVAGRRRDSMRDQDFAELQAAMRLDHHDLAPLEPAVALRKSGESPYLTHAAVAD